MALYIRDPEVAHLADTLQRLTRASSKTQAVRAALQRAVDEASARVPLAVRLQDAVALARRIGPVDPTFDAKAFNDDMWGV